MKKRHILGWLGFILLVIVTAAIVVALNIGTILKPSIETNLTSLLGTPVKITDLKVNLWQGKIAIDGLTVQNPSGYRNPLLMRVGQIQMQVEWKSLLGNTLHLQELGIKSISIDMEQKLPNNNLLDVLRNLQKPSPTQPNAPEKKIKIDRFTLDNFQIRARLNQFGVNLASVDAEISSLRLNNLGSGSDQGVLMRDALSQILLEALTKTLKQNNTVVARELLRVLPQAPQPATGKPAAK
ncbi:MAG: hypothetical protein ACK456_00825 [Pseudanabaenaceae cyanobacterium]|jgi:uncharacterized protein involved in outer membrane biogenesis